MTYRNCLVTGTGRSGTNLMAEFIRATDVFDFTETVEDREFFSHDILPEGYATKLVVEDKSFTRKDFARMLDANPNLVVFFVVRHPTDCCMSKMFRGRPKTLGGEYKNGVFAPDSNVHIAVQRYEDMVAMLVFARNYCGERVFVFKMENIIADTKAVCERICSILNVDFKPDMLEAHRNNRNRFQQERYPDGLLLSEVDIHKRGLEEVYHGFFMNKPNAIREMYELTKRVGPELEYANA